MTNEKSNVPDPSQDNWKRDCYDWLQMLTFVLVAVVMVFTFFGMVNSVVGSSMYPTLHDKDIMLAYRLGYTPAQGDVVVIRKESFMEEAIVKRVSAERKAHFWLFGCLLLYTGMRRGEALALTYGDIDRKAGVIHVTKKLSYATGQVPVLEDHLKSENGRRDIPLLPPLAAALPRNRAGLIFPGEDGGFMRSSEITKNWRRYCRDAGLFAAERASNGETVETFHITPHCFRHSMATICYEAGLDPRQTARILGDAVETVEGVYTHLRQQRQKSAAEILAEYCK